jgi:hypothetical protein
LVVVLVVEASSNCAKTRKEKREKEEGICEKKRRPVCVCVVCVCECVCVRTRVSFFCSMCGVCAAAVVVTRAFFCLARGGLAWVGLGAAYVCVCVWCVAL